MVCPFGRYTGSPKLCYYCEREMTERQNGEKPRLTDRTKDHIVPKSKGGMLTPENKVYACYECNQKKGSKSYEEFMEQTHG